MESTLLVLLSMARRGKGRQLMSKYRTTWSQIQEQMNEFALSYTVRYTDPQNKKRFAIPYKDKNSADDKAAQLKKNFKGYGQTAVNNVTVTKDILRGKFKEELDLQETNPMGYTVKFANSKGAKIATAWYKDEADAKKALEMIKKNGGNGIISKGKMDEGLEDLDEAMNPAQIKKLKDSWADIKLMSPEKVKTLKNFLDKYSTDTLMQLSQAGINFVSNMARSVASKRKVGDMKHAGSMKEEVKTDNEKIADLRVRQMALQTKLKDMDVGDPKDKTPIAITKNDIENIQMKMDQIKAKTKKEEVHPAKALIEAIEAVKNKAEKSGMPYSILKQVYDRGMAAWKGGHRPGTTPQQWALARVNSFVTKSSGTWGGADSDLAKKVRSKK